MGLHHTVAEPGQALAMQEYDVTLKLLLRGSASLTMRELTGATVERWPDAELPKVQNARMDLLGETAGEKDLVHLELQSGNDGAMPIRMAEYSLSVFRLFGKFPRQVLLYVGDPPLRMETELRGPDVWFRYRAVDIRELDGDRLLESTEVGDNVIAILARLRDHGDAVRRIVERTGTLTPLKRETALRALLTLAGLRRFEEVVEREIRKMPIYIDILENKVLGREYKRGLQEGELAILRRANREALRLCPRLGGGAPGQPDCRRTGGFERARARRREH
jgi:hypothetical protein